MSNETLKKINGLLKTFNETFEIKANIKEIDSEIIAEGLKIDSLKKDGSLFIDELISIFNTIIESVSSEHELIFDEKKGLVIAKKIIVTNYQIEDFEKD